MKFPGPTRRRRGDFPPTPICSGLQCAEWTFYCWPLMSSHQARSEHNDSILLTGGRSTCTRDLFQALEFHRLPAGIDLNCPTIGRAGLVMSLF